MQLSELSLVIPVYNEADNISELFKSISANIGSEPEILICYDFDEDNTIPAVLPLAAEFSHLKLVKNRYDRGPLGAIRSGFNAASGCAVLVVMADLSDDLSAVKPMLKLFDAGCSVVAGSRYMKDGRQIGGPLLKRTLSRLAGVSLYHLAGLGTHDATNSFKLYSRKFLDSVKIESTGGFELGIEITVKAHLAGAKIGEVPSIWTDRTAGKSRFKLCKWLPSYLRWYLHAIAGRRQKK
jgi:dolichol-phosphate mannosyltransferase